MTRAAVLEAGQGDTAVLLLHGIGGGALMWAEAGSGSLQALAGAGFHALALDFPGYGAAAEQGPPTMERMVAAVATLANSLRAQRVVLVGHSMGGMVAQELVARSAATVHGLVLSCTSSSFGRSDGEWQARFVAERLAPLEAGLGMPGMPRNWCPFWWRRRPRSALVNLRLR